MYSTYLIEATHSLYKGVGRFQYRGDSDLNEIIRSDYCFGYTEPVGSKLKSEYFLLLTLNNKNFDLDPFIKHFDLTNRFIYASKNSLPSLSHEVTIKTATVTYTDSKGTEVTTTLVDPDRKIFIRWTNYQLTLSFSNNSYSAKNSSTKMLMIHFVPQDYYREIIDNIALLTYLSDIMFVLKLHSAAYTHRINLVYDNLDKPINQILIERVSILFSSDVNCTIKAQNYCFNPDKMII